MLSGAVGNVVNVVTLLTGEVADCVADCEGSSQSCCKAKDLMGLLLLTIVRMSSDLAERSRNVCYALTRFDNLLPW